MMRSPEALIALALLACGGDHSSVTAPPPPPLPPIARLVLEDTSALVFTGSSVPGRAFVAHAYDATGAEVRDPVLALSAGSGWTIRGDTLIAPASEGRTTLRITAKRPAPTSSEFVRFDKVGADVVGADSAVTDSVDVTAGIDLRASHWTVAYTCRMREPSTVRNDRGVPIDSVAVAGATVDSVVYPGDSGWVRNYGGIAQVWFSGIARQFTSDGASDTAAVRDAHMELGLQAPDTLYWYGAGNNPARGDLLYPAAMVDSAPRQYMEPGGYAGVTLCNSVPTRPDTLWLKEVP